MVPFWQRSSRLPVFSKASRARDKREEGLKTSNREQYILLPPPLLLYTRLIFHADFVPRNHHSNRFKPVPKGLWINVAKFRDDDTASTFPSFPRVMDCANFSFIQSLSFFFLLRRRSKGEYIYMYWGWYYWLILVPVLVIKKRSLSRKVEDKSWGLVSCTIFLGTDDGEQVIYIHCEISNDRSIILFLWISIIWEIFEKCICKEVRFRRRYISKIIVRWIRQGYEVSRTQCRLELMLRRVVECSSQIYFSHLKFRTKLPCVSWVTGAYGAVNTSSRVIRNSLPF